MIDYKVIDEDPEKYNPTAKKILLKTPVETAEHGVIKECFIIHSTGMGRETGLFVDDELFIEGLTEEALFWRLAKVSENFNVEVTHKE